MFPPGSPKPHWLWNPCRIQPRFPPGGIPGAGSTLIPCVDWPRWKIQPELVRILQFRAKCSLGIFTKKEEGKISFYFNAVPLSPPVKKRKPLKSCLFFLVIQVNFCLKENSLDFKNLLGCLEIPWGNLDVFLILVWPCLVPFSCVYQRI